MASAEPLPERLARAGLMKYPSDRPPALSSANLQRHGPPLVSGVLHYPATGEGFGQRRRRAPTQQHHERRHSSRSRTYAHCSPLDNAAALPERRARAGLMKYPSDRPPALSSANLQRHGPPLVSGVLHYPATTGGFGGRRSTAPTLHRAARRGTSTRCLHRRPPPSSAAHPAPRPAGQHASTSPRRGRRHGRRTRPRRRRCAHAPVP